MEFLSMEFARKLEKEKKLCIGEYDFKGSLYPKLQERPRFSAVTALIDKMDFLVTDEAFSERYTNHYFIHCSTVNDGVAAALALCHMIYSKYIYEAGDYLVDRSRPVSTNAMPVGMNINIIPAPFSNTVEEEDQEDDNCGSDDNNPSVFLYHRSSPEDIFNFDSEGIRICFVIYADDKINAMCTEAQSAFSETSQTVLSPRQAAAQLHYTYIDIPADQCEEKMCVMVDQVNKNGYSCEKVKKQIRDLSRHPLVKDEYQAVAAIKHVINNHIEFFGESGYLLPIDFRDYVAAKEASAKKKSSINLVGLEKELGMIRGAVNLLSFDIERRDKGMVNDVSGCNMVFAGQPGTAKTTAAREFARILAENKIIPGIENFRECSKSDIVGQYVGHTAKKVDSMFRELDSKGGGVIFFDEIYTLSEKNNTCYDTEAINCITQNMENYRSKVFCIFAGYENKMKEFIEANPGLSSRVSMTIRFSPYDDETLCKIFDSIVKQNGFVVNGEYYEVLKAYFGRLRELRKDNFGNGREARNLFENAKRFTANRAASCRKRSKSMLTTIDASDIYAAADEILESVISGEDNSIGTIGF